MKRTDLVVPQRPTGRPSRRWLNLFSLSAALALAAPGVLAQETFIAYVIPAGTVGNQAFGGTLGMEFDVNNPIIVTRIGVFDDGSDGLNLPISARLYDRSTEPPTALVYMDFTPEDPGELVGGSRFKPLDTPLRLEVGFLGTIVAEGYGTGEQLRNSGNGGVVWTTQDGNGSIAFVGLSRYGTFPGDYPFTADGGPADRYAAGTFEYQTTPPVAPGKPIIALDPADQEITVSWEAVTLPAPAAKYRVLRGDSAAGPFTQIAEVAETSYVDKPLVNGTVYCYVVRGVTAGGREGPDSAPLCAAPYAPLPENQVVAYFVPATVAGTQAFNGALGMEFNVANPVIIRQLGVFDDDSDGLKLGLTARIYDRDTLEVKAEVYFNPGDGTPLEGMRFLPLDPPLELPAGFKGLIEADGYGAEEMDGNLPVTVTRPWTTNDGDGSLVFVGTGRWGTDPYVYPANADAGLANQYAAGTFIYETTPPQLPGTPIVQVLLPPEDAMATLSWNEIFKPLPAAKFRVFRAASADGPWTQVAEVEGTSYQDTGLENGTPVFYKLVAVAAGGQTSFDSNIVTVTPNPRRPGIAYVNPEFKEGNQAFGGSLGMDFNVARPIQITKLGVFDEYGDGLFLTLHAAVWDRKALKELVNIEFTPEDSGELVGGSRFKTLATPLVLPAGFQGTMVAYGYGEGERLFNTGNRPDDVALLSTFDGSSLLFVGTSRFSATPGAYPETADGGPANRYGAGTFAFEPITLEAPTLTIALAAGKIVITWTNGGTLYSATEVNGPWTEVAGASSGIEITPSEARAFYRVQQ